MVRKVSVVLTVSLLWTAVANSDAKNNNSFPAAVPINNGQTASPVTGQAPAANTQSVAVPGTPGATTTPAGQTPADIGRVFLTIMRYTMESNGEPTQPVSNVRITFKLPNGQKIPLPENSQWWPIGNGQAQEINRIYEVPAAWVVADGFKFSIQMERKGSDMLPCEFDVSQLSAFNRSYTCHTDITWQQNQKIADDRLDREGIQVRVFTSKNSEKKDIPTDAIALR